mmetsp:Transcript_12359/g.27255  ORF Transcript_12359/g.27255 Transcript_12359/m.27255 type:complete len:96 (+) Transcript_12359:234-521(+)
MNIFVRDCYHEYYDYVLESMAKGKHYIVVTGTPGIGKSVFYMHFLEKYRTENPDNTIVVIGDPVGLTEPANPPLFLAGFSRAMRMKRYSKVSIFH